MRISTETGRVLQLKEQGLGGGQIAERLGISSRRVYRILQLSKQQRALKMENSRNLSE